LYPGKAPWNITYTIGQRKKLGIASSAPLSVNKLDAPNKSVVVGSREELFSKGLIARDVNLIALDRLERPYKVKAKIRYRRREADAALTACNEKGARVIFDEAQLR
jgi:tRNA-specific 2-thiouridylase